MSDQNCSKTPKRQDSITKPAFAMALALLAAERSKDPNTQVGCCLVDERDRIISVGYNGLINGIDDDSINWAREGECPSDTKYPFIIHAEVNALLNSHGGISSVSNATAYVTLFPCPECAKSLAQAGISKIYYLNDKYKDTETDNTARKVLAAAGVQFEQYKPSGKKITFEL